MAQTSALLRVLKQRLRAHRVTYTGVAAALDLSVASVKRLFAEEAFSLKRLDQVCALIGIELTDLLREVAAEAAPLSALSEAQEAAIADDIPLLLVTVAVLNHLDFAAILARFDISEHDCIRKLAWLDRAGIIELRPGNVYRTCLSSNFAWRVDGPIQRFFLRHLSSEYFSGTFSGEHEHLLVLNGMFTDAELTELRTGIRRLVREFNALNEQARAAPLEARSGHTAVIAFRPWVLGTFADYLRD